MLLVQVNENVVNAENLTVAAELVKASINGMTREQWDAYPHNGYFYRESNGHYLGFISPDGLAWATDEPGAKQIPLSRKFRE